jgi:predicted RecA/RadA family phage recombinase
MKNYVQKGDVLDYTVPAETEIASGDIVKAGSLIGIAATDGVAGDVIAVNLCGVFEVGKETGAVTVGAPLYFKASTGKATTDDESDANALMGYAFSAQSSGDTTVKVKLLG